MTDSYRPQLIVIQPAIPNYRRGFFNAVADILGERLSVYASDVNMGVLTEQAASEPWRKPLGPMYRLAPGAEWQRGALSVPIRRGDVLVVSGAPRCLSNILLLLKARILGARTVWWGQLWSATSRRHRFILRLMLMRLAHSVLFYTDAELAAYKAGPGRKDRRLLGALNNGIDVKPIQLRRAPYEAVTRPETILFLGRLTEKAQISLLLQAMTYPALANATLNVVGDGADATALQEWALQNGLEESVIWNGGTIDERAIAQIANRSAVFCYPGGVGLSLIHAMAYGLPTVVHDDRSKHMPEIAAFEDGITGATFAMSDPHSLANVLANLLANGEARMRMSKEAVRRADKMYNTDVMANRFLEFFRDFSERP